MTTGETGVVLQTFLTAETVNTHQGMQWNKARTREKRVQLE